MTIRAVVNMESKEMCTWDIPSGGIKARLKGGGVKNDIEHRLWVIPI